MHQVFIYSILLIPGLVASQFMPQWLGDQYADATFIIHVLAIIGLAYIMIQIGSKLDIDKSNLRQYGSDYAIAFTAATFPWIFVTTYFLFVMIGSQKAGTWDSWTETLLAGRFAALHLLLTGVFILALKNLLHPLFHLMSRNMSPPPWPKIPSRPLRQHRAEAPNRVSGGAI